MSDKLSWFKSSYSGSEPKTDCVEIAASSGRMRVRDSKLGGVGPRLSIPAHAWEAFITYASEAAAG
ncbi:DUF397 domain-containing protein [Streptomyces roseoverticillatus]|uniref:DUF397 domain-containing protein n=1 Tax=Streptomyces roseoverticillatus TaxID=66429 RepID=UPI001F2E0F88|nr:DUF397 domain-containing protein [Streptomyces roseoverticillatus]MCF3100387.1 DUF397 domain-containing protein [Streptomyces roseoverticillatus]